MAKKIIKEGESFFKGILDIVEEEMSQSEQRRIKKEIRAKAQEEEKKREKSGEKLRASVWFEHAHKDAHLTEYKIFSEKYDHVLTLLVLPRNLEVRPPKHLD